MAVVDCLDVSVNSLCTLLNGCVRMTHCPTLCGFRFLRHRLIPRNFSSLLIYRRCALLWLRFGLLYANVRSYPFFLLFLLLDSVPFQ